MMFCSITTGSDRVEKGAAFLFIFYPTWSCGGWVCFFNKGGRVSGWRRVKGPASGRASRVGRPCASSSEYKIPKFLGLCLVPSEMQNLLPS